MDNKLTYYLRTKTELSDRSSAAGRWSPACARASAIDLQCAVGIKSAKVLFLNRALPRVCWSCGTLEKKHDILTVSAE